MNNLTAPSPAGSSPRFASNSLLAPNHSRRAPRHPAVPVAHPAPPMFAHFFALTTLVWSALVDELGA